MQILHAVVRGLLHLRAGAVEDLFDLDVRDLSADLPVAATRCKYCTTELAATV